MESLGGSGVNLEAHGSRLREHRQAGVWRRFRRTASGCRGRPRRHPPSGSPQTGTAPPPPHWGCPPPTAGRPGLPVCRPQSLAGQATSDSEEEEEEESDLENRGYLAGSHGQPTPPPPEERLKANPTPARGKDLHPHRSKARKGDGSGTPPVSPDAGEVVAPFPAYHTSWGQWGVENFLCLQLFFGILKKTKLIQMHRKLHCLIRCEDYQPCLATTTTISVLLGRWRVMLLERSITLQQTKHTPSSRSSCWAINPLPTARQGGKGTLAAG